MKQRKVEARLNARVRDYEAMVSSGKHESKVEQRLRSGGYTRLGSRKQAG